MGKNSSTLQIDSVYERRLSSAVRNYEEVLAIYKRKSRVLKDVCLEIARDALSKELRMKAGKQYVHMTNFEPTDFHTR